MHRPNTRNAATTILAHLVAEGETLLGGRIVELAVAQSLAARLGTSRNRRLGKSVTMLTQKYDNDEQPRCADITVTRDFARGTPPDGLQVTPLLAVDSRGCRVKYAEN